MTNAVIDRKIKIAKDLNNDGKQDQAKAIFDNVLKNSKSVLTYRAYAEFLISNNLNKKALDLLL